MILSVSRRTDIPAFYPKWFINRLREGYVMTRNPMNYHGVSRINLSPDIVDFIVFWTKNPMPLFEYLDEISEKYMFYFQYTLNAYEQDIEPNIPDINTKLSAFKYLSEKYGKKRVIWRYDPILLTPKYSVDWHIHQFQYLVNQLEGFTDTCIFSFVDIYDKAKNKLNEINILPITLDDMNVIAREFSAIAQKYKITLKTCAEEIDLNSYEIKHSCCVDPELISELIDCKILTKKDSNQREICGCVESVDIGQYNTCKHGCRYCYANYSTLSIERCYAAHLPDSPILIGTIEPEDKETQRKVKSLRQKQISLF